MPMLAVNTATDGATLVAAPTGPRQFIRVTGGDLSSGGTGTVSLKSNTTVIWGPANVVAGVPVPITINENTTIDCVPGQALLIGITGSVTIGGGLEYCVFGPPNVPAI